MKLRWLQVVNEALLQKNGRNSEHFTCWKSGFSVGEVKDKVNVSNFEEERKRGFQRRNTLGTSNCAGRRNFKVSNEGQNRGITSKRCSGEFDFMVTGKDSGAVNLETKSDSRLQNEDNGKGSTRKDTTLMGREGMKVYRPEDKDTFFDKRLWLEQRSLTILDERILMDPSLSKDAEVIRGQLWVQRSSLFAQWKERHLVLRGRVLEVHRLEGGLVSLIGLSQVNRLKLTERRGTLTICVSLDRGNFYMRRADGLNEWFKRLGDGIKNNGREKEILLFPISREEPKITLEELTRLYREEEDDTIEEARRRGRRDFGIRSETLKEMDKDSGIGSLQSNASLPFL